MKPIKLATMDCKQVCAQIGDFVIETVLETGSTGCVIGLSGGVDSSTAAALIKTGFDRHNTQKNQNLELVGYILPSGINRTQDERDAESVAAFLGIRYEIHRIENLIESYRLTNPEAFESYFHKGNMISRIRANVLSTKAATENKTLAGIRANVLSTKAATENKTLAGTGNKDEDFGIGYYTLFGDGAVHISPIAGLPKRLVREMAAYLGLDKQIIQREPTAGLEPEQSDFKDLGYDYDVVELITTGLEQGVSKKALGEHEQIVPLVEKQIEQYKKIYGSAKFTSVQEVVEDVLKRHRQAKGKMKILSPPTPRITLAY
jgi:NAD+ synthase